MQNPRVRLGIQLLLLFAAILLAYSNHFNNAFQFDDTHTVQANMAVRSLSNIPSYFVDPNTSSYRPENSGYRPMTTTFLALGFALSAIDTWGYHVLKLLEHFLVTILVFFLALRLLPRGGAASTHREWVAFLSALVFGVHAAHTEVVNYICAVSTLQAGLFFIGAFLLYLKWRESRKPWLFALSCLFYMCSMWSKEEGITLPLMIVIYEWVYSRAPENTYIQTLLTDRNWLKWILRATPYAVLAVIYCGLRWGLMDAVAHTSTGKIPRDVYFLTQLHSWLHYWWQFFWPNPLNADNLSFPWITEFSDPILWASVATHVAIFILAWFVGKRFRSAWFLILWIYVTVLPASSFFPLVEAVNEHRAYIPYMGFTIALTWAISEVLLKFRIRFAAIAGLFVLLSSALGWATFERNKDWATDLSLWEDILSKNPTSPRAMNVLGVSLIQRGEFVRSRQLLEKCFEINPQFLPCHVHLSMIYAQSKEFDKGLAVLQQSLQIDPNYPHTNYHLGLYYKDYLGNPEAARPYLANVVRLTQGRFYHANLKLAEIEMVQGNVRAGMNIADSILKFDQLNGDAWEILGRGYYLAGNKDEALRIFTRLHETSPEVFRYSLDVANVYERQGDFAQARHYFEVAVAKEPKLIQGWIGLARTARELKDESAMKEAEKVVEGLKAGRQWIWVSALFLVGEAPDQVAPK